MFRRWKMILPVLAVLFACLFAGSALAEDPAFTFTILDDGTASITGTLEYDSDKLEIPDEVDGYTVTAIADEAFCFTDITELVMADTITQMGTSAFYGCYNLETAKLSSALEIIPAGAFEECSSLHTVNIPSSVKEIGEWAFGWTALESAEIPKGVEIIRYGAFERSDIRSAVLPEGLKEVDGCFVNCKNLTSVTLPEDMTVIPSNMFDGCEKLKRINIPASVKTIERWAFSDTGIETLIIPEGVEKIECFALRDTQLKNAVLPASAVSLGEYYNPYDYYTEYDAIFSSVENLYVVEGSAGQEYAEKYGMSYILYGAEKPKVVSVECSKGTVCEVFDTVKWAACAIGCEDPEYFCILYKDGKSIYSGWQSENEFSRVIDETGTYSIKFMVKTPAGIYSDYSWASDLEVLEDLPKAPVISDFVIYSPDTIKLDMPIMWSYRVRGGDGDFCEDLYEGYMLSRNGEEADYLYDVDLIYQSEPGGAYIRGSYIPDEPGTYAIYLTAQDSSGAQSNTVEFPEITVEENTFRITNVTSSLYTAELPAYDTEYDYYEAQTVSYAKAGEKVTWNAETEGATGEVIYTAEIVAYTLADGYDTVVKQVVTSEPEFSYTFENVSEWGNRIKITAYDTGSGSVATYCGEEFMVDDGGMDLVPIAWYLCEEYYCDEDWETGVRKYKADFSIDVYDERLFPMMEERGIELKFDLYLDGELLKSSGWTEETAWESEITVGGTYCVKASMRNDAGEIFAKEGRNESVSVSQEFVDFDIYKAYYEGDMSVINWSIRFWHNDDDCDQENCEHLESRFTLYRDDEIIETSEWSTDHMFELRVTDYGVYRANVELRSDEEEIVYTEMTDDFIVNAPGIRTILNGANQSKGVWTGQCIDWEVYAEGGLHPDRNSISATLYRNGEVYKTFDWQKMTSVENYNYGGWHGFCMFSDVVTVSGIYTLEARLMDENGMISEPYMSGEVFVADYRGVNLTLESISCNAVSVDVGAGKPVVWNALSFGGSASILYNFEVLFEDSVIAQSGWQESNTYRFVPETVGEYKVRVTAKDAETEALTTLTSRSVLAINAAEHTVLDIDVSAGVIYPRVGDRFMVDLVVEPEIAEKNVGFTTSNAAVATVDSHGLITIVGKGDAVITLTANDSLDIRRELKIHASEYTVATVPESVVRIEAEAFENSAFEGLDLSETSGVTLAENALDGSIIKCVYISDNTVIEDGAFGSSSPVLYCASEKQADTAATAGADYVMVD